MPDGRLNPTAGDTIDCTTANIKGCVGRTTEVGSYDPNPLGISDLAGNVMEWVEDHYQADYYSVLKSFEPVQNPPYDPRPEVPAPVSSCIYSINGPYGDACYVNRGGAYSTSVEISRGTFRNFYDDATGWGGDFMIGFRCAADGP
jgi:formylglycine-generating enzyme required for sulfatase activity